jgi:hypothetical protein
MTSRVPLADRKPTARRLRQFKKADVTNIAKLSPSTRRCAARFGHAPILQNGTFTLFPFS